MNQIFIDLFSNILWLVLGILGLKLADYFRIALPSRRIWKIAEPKELVICAANSTVTDTGEYMRPATGIGQVRAMALVVASLNRTYGKLDYKKIFLSTDQLNEDIESNLILLGGAKNNQLTARYLELLKEFQPALNNGSEIIWRKKLDNKWSADDADKFQGETVQGTVATDYGLAIRTRNPFTEKPRTAILFAGSHTYGTIAAAKFFIESLNKALPKEVTKPNISVLVSTHIIQGYPTTIKLERFYAWE
jgi:hypothetical protein